MVNKYIFKPYDLIFPSLFGKEKNRLAEHLTGDYRIEHIGSTAVPNLGGKGIIDIYIAANKKDLERTRKEILKAGYEYRPKASTARHLFYRIDLPDKVEGMRRYHAHVSYFEGRDFKDAVMFRDYLRKHSQEVNRYALIKQKAANEANQDRDTYLSIKSPIINDILRKARLESKNRG